MFEQNQPTMGRTKMKIPLGKLTWDCLYIEAVPKGRSWNYFEARGVFNLDI